MTQADEDRRAQFVRQWRILVALRQAPRTLQELAELLEVHERTIRRDLRALQRVPLPIASRFDGGKGVRAVDPTVWYLGEMPAWPRDASSPIGDLAEAGQ